ncbi:MAG TPA: dihydroneopterin aldolase [Myxococcales bacterium LLY-WYZ-16_1]|jgi:7,8-dihydroneopterin aldolase/epimerase/oxygenase|nr:dihydroneopterin aldolase [Myxococcales bacterium LLY-WYZ-16_1]
MDVVALEGLELRAPVGVYPFERDILQRIRVSLRAELDLTAAGRSDALGDGLDYDRLAAACREVAAAKHHRLIESIAAEIVARVLQEHEAVEAVWVRVEKPGAVPDAEQVAVELRRERRKPRTGLFGGGR